MTFAAPLLAGVAAAIAIPALLILYFLKLRRREVEVSTTLLWKKAIQDLQANAPFQKLRKNILLLLQLLVLIAALLALAQPEIRGQARTGERTILLIDRSASMQALDGAEDGSLTRLEAAKQLAIEQVEAMREPGLLSGAETADQAMVIAFDESAEVVEHFTSDKRRLIEAIRSIRPTDAPSSLREAFALVDAQRPRVQPPAGAEPADPARAAALDEAPPPVRPQLVHLFTDGRLPDAGSVLPEAPDQIRLHAIGDPNAPNLGITAVRAERRYDQPAQLSIFVGVENTDRVQREADLELLIDGQIAGVRRVTLPPATAPGDANAPSGDVPAEGVPPATPTPPRTPGAGGAVFQMTRPEPALVEVRLRPVFDGGTDVLRVDDAATLVVGPARRTSVAVVTPGNLFLTEALRGLPLAQLDTYTPESYQAAARSGRLPAHDVTILDGWLPDAPSAAAGADGLAAPGLPPGNWLVFGAVPEPPFGLRPTGEVAPAQFIDWRRTHPALGGLTLAPVRIAELIVTEIPDGSTAEVIAETNEGPGLVELSAAATRAIVAPFDVAASNWPFDVSFVVFLAAAIDHLDTGSASTEGLGARQIPTGQILSDRLPPGAQGIVLTPPSGPDIPLTPAGDGRVVYGPLKQAGVYRLAWSGPAGVADTDRGGRVERLYAVNLASSSESDVPASAQLVTASSVVQAVDPRETERTQRLWPWFVLAALALLMLEWWVYNRKMAI